MNWPFPTPQGLAVPTRTIVAQAADATLTLPATPRTLLVHCTAALLRDAASWPMQQAEDSNTLGLDYRLIGSDQETLTGLSAQILDPMLQVTGFTFFRLGALLTLSGGAPGNAAMIQVAARFSSGRTQRNYFALPVTPATELPRLPGNALLIGGVPVSIGGQLMLLE